MSNENDLPAGRYQGRARPSMSFTTAASGNLRVAVTIDLVNEGYEDRRVVWFSTFAPGDGEDITIRSLRDMGWASASLDDFTGLGDRDVAVVIKYRDYEGKPQMDVDIWPLGGSTFTFEAPADSGALAAAAQRLKGKLVASVPKKRPEGAAAKPAPAWKPPARPAAPAPARAPATGGTWDGQGVDPSLGDPLDDLPF